MLINSYIFNTGAPSLIPSNVDRPSLVCFLTGEEQVGADASAISTITDQSGNVGSITTSGVIVNIAADGSREFDFSNSTTARIDLGQPAALDFPSLGSGYTVSFVTGEIDDTTGGGTIWAKNDKALGMAQSALFVTDATAPIESLYIEWFANGVSKTISDISGQNNLISLVYTTSGSENRVDTYVNGVKQGSTDATTNTTTRAEPWIIGVQKNGGGWADPTNSSIKWWAVHDEVLTPAILTNIYNAL